MFQRHEFNKDSFSPLGAGGSAVEAARRVGGEGRRDQVLFITSVHPCPDPVFSEQASHCPACKYSFAEHVTLSASLVSLCPGFSVNPESNVQSPRAVLPSATDE
jgi:hypothetical protein